MSEHLLLGFSKEAIKRRSSLWLGECFNYGESDTEVVSIFHKAPAVHGQMA